MRIDRHSRQLAKAYFRACLREDGAIDDAALREIIGQLIRQKPRHLRSILSRLQRLIEIAVEERTVRIESATPLADKGAQIIADLERQYGPAARTFYEENSSLLGGLRIRRGSRVWDGTLKSRLNQLKLALA